jgi:hypothetical protein
MSSGGIHKQAYVYTNVVPPGPIIQPEPPMKDTMPPAAVNADVVAQVHNEMYTFKQFMFSAIVTLATLVFASSVFSY